MKKSFLTLLLVFVVALIAIAFTYTTPREKQKLTVASWSFKSVSSNDPATAHYVNSIYEGSEYSFADDRTFTGTFFGITVSGTWDTYNEVLILNRGTSKEEMYTFSISDEGGLVLEGTEKGKKVFINFIKK